MARANQTDRRRPIGRGAIGVLVQDGRCLLVRRALHLTKGGLWCFPGGHVERNETSRMAILREMHEELGVDVQPLRKLGAVRVLDSGYILAVWHVDLRSGELRPNPAEIMDITWCTANQIGAFDGGLASNAQVVRLMERHDLVATST